MSAASELKSELLGDWEPESIFQKCLQSRKERLLIKQATDGNPNWVYRVRSDDDERYVRNASAVGVKAKARFP